MSEPLTVVDLSGEIQTRIHRERVAEILHLIIRKLLDRAESHDSSKLKSPEVGVFAEYTPKLENMTYVGDEYNKCLVEMGPALAHHYANNSHHPEHHKDGINDMTLVDLIEMLVDWKAASERHKNGNILVSIDKNSQRFHIDAQLTRILVNTVRFLSFVE